LSFNLFPSLCLLRRPKRQRKLPARMQNNDFEYGFGPALASEPEPEEKQASPKKRGRQTKAGSDEKVSYNLINCISVALW
jgi:hypothetical protein